MKNCDSAIEQQNQKKYFCIPYICNLDAATKLLLKSGFDFQNHDHILIVLGPLLGYFSDKDFDYYGGKYHMRGHTSIRGLLDDDRIILISNDQDNSLIKDIEALSNEKSEFYKYCNMYVFLSCYDIEFQSIISRMAGLLGCPAWIFWKFKEELIAYVKNSKLIRFIKELQTTYYKIDNYIFCQRYMNEDMKKQWQNCIFVNGYNSPYEPSDDKHKFPYKKRNRIEMNVRDYSCLVFNINNKGEVQSLFGQSEHRFTI